MTEHTSVGERKRMVEPDHSGLSVLQQCILLGLSRSSFYYKPVGESEFNLMIMRIMDEIYLDYPYYGVRRIMAELQRRGYGVGEKRVQRLMKLMGIEAMYPSTTSAPQLLPLQAEVIPQHIQWSLVKIPQQLPDLEQCGRA